MVGWLTGVCWASREKLVLSRKVWCGMAGVLGGLLLHELAHGFSQLGDLLAGLLGLLKKRRKQTQTCLFAMCLPLA